LASGTVSTGRATASLVVLSVAAFGFVTIEILPIGLLTLIADDLHRSRSDVGLLMTGYAVVVMLASVPLTMLTRRVPRRWLLAGTLGVFAAGALASALARSYPVLLGARLVVALSQAVFWSVVVPAATGLFRPEIRGRTVARLAIGNALAPVLGVPAGTWLGQQAGWRAPFVVMAIVGIATCAAVTVLVPTIAPADAGAARGTGPDVGRYAVLVVATTVCVAGFLTTFTYVTPFLLDVSGFAPESLGPLLAVIGLAGVVGTVLVGTVLDRYPRGALVGTVGLLAAALVGLYVAGTVRPAAVALTALSGLAYSAFAAAVGGRSLQVAPGSTDLASAGTSTAFNVGIAAGSFIGGALIANGGVRSVAIVGGLLAVLALAVLASERRWARPLATQPDPSFV
jgi:DHA1 family L-arabinose/isopropyl-beta-D-thiogalactopyranoside export protein-like MFS transporter/DHA1 family inner membrane transport protein